MTIIRCSTPDQPRANDLSLHMATFAFLTLILLVTLGNMLLGFGTAVYFGHGPKGLSTAISGVFKRGHAAKPAQKSPQSPH